MPEATRRGFLRALGAGAAAVTLPSLLSSCAKPASKRPNILFILSDDHASQAISAYGGGLNATPQIDRLAKEGVRFDHCFSTNAICAPSRASILTGTYSHVHGVIDNAMAFDGSQPTFPKLLQGAGYETALFGKWHLKSDPTGFDLWDILPGQGQYYNPDFIRNGQRRRVEGYVTDILTDLCLNWLDGRPDPNRPFCLLLHHKAPHRNWMPALRHLDLFEDVDIPIPETLDDDYATRSEAAREQDLSIEKTLMPGYDLKADPRDAEDASWLRAGLDRMSPAQRAAWDKAYGPRNAAARKAGLTGEALRRWRYQRYIKDYLRCIAAVDESVGRVLDHLDERGLAENTVVIYASDQGFFLGEHGWFDKRFMYEESLRMPLLVRYPAEVAPGRAESHLAANVDLAPTLLDYAGVRAPVRMQGRSLRPLLRGKTPYDWRQGVYYHYFEYPGVHSVKRHYGLRTARYKLIHFYHDIDAWELYDLQNDPYELNNLAGVMAYAGLLKKLKRELRRLQKVYGDDGAKRFLPGKPVTVEHLAVGASLRLSAQPSPKYMGQGPGHLVNGVCAPENLGSQPDYVLWQGFEGTDLEAVVDLGAEKMIQTVTTGFLDQPQAWIFMPQAVTVSLSADGEHWSDSQSWTGEALSLTGPPTRREVALSFPKEKARFVRVQTRSRRVCPSGHAGAGRPCWLFADEILVR